MTVAQTAQNARLRRRYVLKLRRSGMTYRAIGKIIGVNAERARQLYMQAIIDEDYDRKFEEMKALASECGNYLRKATNWQRYALCVR